MPSCYFHNRDLTECPLFWGSIKKYGYYKAEGHIDYIQGTYYLSDLRNSVKGIRVYPRPKETARKEFLRIELELHRRILRELGVEFPLTPDQFPEQLTRFLQFREMDFQKLLNAYLRQNGLDWKSLNLADNPSRRDKFRSVIQQQVASELHGNFRDCKNLIKMMDEVKKLQLSNPNRFMKKLDKLDWIFNNLPHDQGFGIRSR